MILFSSRIELSFWVALFSYGIHILAFNWWDDFFENLRRDDRSYTFTQIWVQNAQKTDPWVSPIGGQEADFASWALHMERWLYETQRHPDSSIQIVLIGDEKTFSYHNDLIKKWNNRYPGVFHFKFYKELISSDLSEELSSLVDRQCSQGLPAACSDFIRISAIDFFETDVFVYMDIDTFIHRLKNARNFYLPVSPLAQDSVLAMGLLERASGIYHGVLYNQGLGIDNHTLRMNNDFLIAIEPDFILKRALLQMAQSRLREYKELLEQILSRKFISSSADYLRYYEKRKSWAKEETTKNFLYIPFVIFSNGPGFWKDAYLLGWSKPYFSEDVFSKGEWMDKGIVTCGASINKIESWGVSESAVSVIAEMLILIEDHFYYSPRNQEIATFIEKMIIQNLQNLSDIEKERFSYFFNYHYDQINKIGHPQNDKKRI